MTGTTGAGTEHVNEHSEDQQWPTWKLAAASVGVLLVIVAAFMLAFRPDTEIAWAAGGVLIATAASATGVLLYRRPELAPWGAVLLFATSAELRLRLTPGIGVLKDVYVAVLVLVVVVLVVRGRVALDSLRPLLGLGIAMGIVVGLYLINPAGQHGSEWVFGTRLLAEVLALFLVGHLLAPAESIQQLVRAMTVVLPLQSAYSLIQQSVGGDRLVQTWGYQFGAQVRISSSGALRTSGTFEDPFQLGAFAVLGITLGLFVASRWQAVVLTTTGLAALATTSVRTTVIQVGVLGLVWAVRRGWWRQAIALTAVAAVAAVLVLARTTVVMRPGGPEESILLNLNGRTTAWGMAVDGWNSFLFGNGVGVRGIGSERSDDDVVSDPPSYDPGSPPPAAYPGDPTFLDSAYAQVQSDTGILGTVALLTALALLAVRLVQTCRASRTGASWAACALLAISMIDWIGRSSMAAYTTGFFTLYVLGILIGASRSSSAS